VNQEQNTVEGRREMLDFYYNKSKIWTYESEYRILTFGYLSSIMGIFAKYNNVKLTWDDKCEILKTKYLSFNTYFDLSSRYKKFMSHQDSKNLNPSGYVGVNGISQSVTLDIPHYDTLLIDMPKASKMILGWNFSKHKKDYIIKKCKEKNIILSEISIPLDVTSSEYEETILFDGVANE
jgi:hypothetical protein